MAGTVRNWFANPGVAARYAAGRPDVHGPIADHIRDRLACDGPLARAADAGCGTGLSARALQRVAAAVVGVDPSVSMLAEARARGGPSWVCGLAEALPLADASLDLLTAACAWHWFDQPVFLDEAVRVLVPDGWLVVYDSDFKGDSSQPALLEWLRQDYWSRLVWVERYPFFDSESHRHPRFRLAAQEELRVEMAMTQQEVKTLITSQASTMGNVEQGFLTLAEAEARLDVGLAPFWSHPDERRLMCFVSPLHFLQRR